MRPAFRPAAGGARAAGNRDQGARSCFRTQDRPSIRAHKRRAHKQGHQRPRPKRSSSRSRGRVRTARASGKKAHRRPGRNGSTAHRSQSVRSTRANEQRGLGSRKAKGIAISRSDVADRTRQVAHRETRDVPRGPVPRAQRRPRSMPLPSPRSDPGHPWASLADGGRLAPWLEGGGGQRSNLPRSIGSLSLEIPFPNVSRPA
jgi:hypothetical protein